jgi:hypothetical protein
MAIMTAEKLKSVALNIAEDYRTVYLWGGIGQIITARVIAQKAAQYPNWYTASRIRKLEKYIGTGTWGFDCVCFIKSILWGWRGDASKAYGGAQYCSNGVPDVTANGMFDMCSDVSTDFSRIEVGEAVHMDGHIGIYIGDDLVVECTPSFEDGVQVTFVKNRVSSKDGYSHGRWWTDHGKLPWIDYDIKEDDSVSYEEFKDFMKRYEKEVAAEPVSDWARDAMEKAVAAGIFRGDENGEMQPKSPVTRQAAAILFDRLGLID